MGAVDWIFIGAVCLLPLPLVALLLRELVVSFSNPVSSLQPECTEQDRVPRQCCGG